MRRQPIAWNIILVAIHVLIAILLSERIIVN